MDLIIPSAGLIFWQLIGFLALLFILIKFAWKPILASLAEREASIDGALKSAEQARNEMANLKAENEKLLQEARLERDVILSKAHEASLKMIEDAKTESSRQGALLIESAKVVIETEKKAALTEVKNQVALLTLEVTEKLLRKKLGDDKAQVELVDQFIKDLKLN
jgi:F-type H+-transporting ATPase subunit b